MASLGADYGVVGKVGRVTGLVAPGTAGEVTLPVRGEAEGTATRAKGMAEADAIRARAEALRDNQEAVINQQIVEEP